MKTRHLGKLITALAISEGAGVTGSLFTAPSISTWYAELAKPALTPPAWVFGPVWTTLYAMMGIAAFLVWKNANKQRGVRCALSTFAIQLVLNVLWSAIFFGLQSPGWAFALILLLWLAIAGTIFAFARISKAAAWLLAPYLGWVTFASYLNYGLMTLNR